MSPSSPPPGWIDPNQPEAANPGTERVLVLAAVGLTVLVLLTMVGVVLVKRGGLFDDHTGERHVSLIAANVETEDPFTPSVVGSPIEIADTVTTDITSFIAQLPVSAGRGARLVPGTQQGLFGGSGETPVCDVPTVANYLDANPDRSAQWAEALRVPPEKIPYYLNTLTPVALIADTWVTMYTLTDGRAVPVQTVLQAGNAVLVDQVGVPRMHCASGDPLAPPANVNLHDSAVGGDAWQGFDLQNVVAIAYSAAGSSRSVVTEFVVRDVSSGEPVSRKTGGTIAITSDPTGWAPDPVAMNVPADE